MSLAWWKLSLTTAWLMAFGFIWLWVVVLELVLGLGLGLGLGIEIRNGIRTGFADRVNPAGAFLFHGQDPLQERRRELISGTTRGHTLSSFPARAVIASWSCARDASIGKDCSDCDGSGGGQQLFIGSVGGDTHRSTQWR